MTARVSARDRSLPALLGDFRLLLALFLSLRLMLPIIFQPLIVDGIERGITAGGDFAYYFMLASLTGQGQWPYLDWWHEFPPLTSHLMVLAYSLSGERAPYTVFSLLFGLLMLVADVGNLALIRLIGARLYDRATGTALAWVYALMLAPLVFMWWNFEALVAFFLLLGLFWLLRGKHTQSAVAVAVGGLTKFTPLILLGAAWRFRSRSAAMRYTALVAALFVLVYAFFWLRSPEMTLPSLTAQFGKASYQTVWALLDGNYTTGLFGTLASHFDPAEATALQGNPSVVPGWLRLMVAGVVGLVAFARTRRFDSRGLVAFVALAFLLFFLQAQGWSPQWLVQIIPLILLCFPTGNGVLALILLSVMAFAEYTLLFEASPTGALRVIPALMPAFVALVLVRTGMLVAFCVGLYRILRQEPVPEGLAA